ncbi:MAG TPA: zinc-binding dehydrogenase [Pseudomonas sp.]|jgi:hypothetical protein
MPTRLRISAVMVWRAEVSPRIGVEVVKPLAEILNVPSVRALISKALRKIGSETDKPSRVGAGLIIAVNLNAQRLEDVLTLGATHVINGDEQYAYKVIQEIVQGGIDFALECIGKPKVLRQAVDALKPMGTCGLLGLLGLLGVSSPGTEVSIEMISLLQGRRLMGIIEGDSDPRMIEMYRGTFPFDKLVSFYPFDHIIEAIADMASGKTGKPILRMPQTKSRSSENDKFLTTPCKQARPHPRRPPQSSKRYDRFQWRSCLVYGRGLNFPPVTQWMTSWRPTTGMVSPSKMPRAVIRCCFTLPTERAFFPRIPS